MPIVNSFSKAVVREFFIEELEQAARLMRGYDPVARGRKRGVHRKRRAPRALPGMLLHIDGSRRGASKPG